MELVSLLVQFSQKFMVFIEIDYKPYAIKFHHKLVHFTIYQVPT